MEKKWGLGHGINHMRSASGHRWGEVYRGSWWGVMCILIEPYPYHTKLLIVEHPTEIVGSYVLAASEKYTEKRCKVFWMDYWMVMWGSS
ncbi:unnamed protein product [Urochloa humidicola]